VGGGNDILNAGFKGDTVVGDSYTRSGRATGGGRDRLHGLTGDDLLRGDNFARNGGETSGGGRDVLNGAAGEDHLHGGPRRDLCAGGGGRDRGRRCEARIGIP
jgi:hypothetical protein